MTKKYSSCYCCSNCLFLLVLVNFCLEMLLFGCLCCKKSLWPVFSLCLSEGWLICCYGYFLCIVIYGNIINFFLIIGSFYLLPVLSFILLLLFFCFYLTFHCSYLFIVNRSNPNYHYH